MIEERMQKTVKITEIDNYGGVEDLVKQLQVILLECPEGRVHYSVETYHEWGNEYARMVIYHTRPETDEEYVARIGAEAARKFKEEQREREELNRLLAKYQL